VDEAVDGVGRHRRHHVDRRIADARRSEQNTPDLVVEPTDSHPHDLGERRRQGSCRGGRRIAQKRTCEFQGVEGIAAGHLGDAHHRRPRKRPPDAVGDHPLQFARFHRTDPHPRQGVRTVELQPGRGTVWRGPFGQQQSDAAPQSTCSEGEKIATRGVEPLDVVDGDEHG
jgi:hypothetical protein